MHWLDIFPKGKSDRTAPSGPAWKVVGGSSSNESTLNDNSSISDVIKGARDNAIADTIGSPGLRQMHSWRELESPRQTSSMPTSPPPTLRAYLYGTVQLEGFHAEKVQELWEMIRKRGSLRHLSESDTDRVLEALRIAYVTLYGKVTLRSLEEAINRARGTAAILGELKADVSVVLAGILHDVLPTFAGDDKAAQQPASLPLMHAPNEGQDTLLGAQFSPDGAATRGSSGSLSLLQIERSIQQQHLSLSEAGREHMMLDGEARYAVEDPALVVRQQLVHRFGTHVMDLVDKYNQLPRFMAQRATYTTTQGENHIQMLVATAADYRVLYMRLAERLHTMRVLKSLPLSAGAREQIAHEALQVYAPLAHKMGVMKVKGELEDLAFRILEPEWFTKTKYTQIAAQKAFHEAADQIQAMCRQDPVLLAVNVTHRLTYRVKSKYQLYLKMKKKGLDSPSAVRDALGLRVILKMPRLPGESEAALRQREEELCYHAAERLGCLNGWERAPDGFKDYLKTPKENGYRSLHQHLRNTALGTSVEVQVRSLGMHLEAELGGAAHWYYKIGRAHV